MSTIYEKSQEILNEKTNKIIPENIKKDVQVFDITGTYEGSDVQYDTYSTIQEEYIEEDPETGEIIAQGYYYDLTINDIPMHDYQAYYCDTFNGDELIIATSNIKDDVGAIGQCYRDTEHNYNWSILCIMIYNNSSNTYRLYADTTLPYEVGLEIAPHSAMVYNAGNIPTNFAEQDIPEFHLELVQ